MLHRCHPSAGKRGERDGLGWEEIVRSASSHCSGGLCGNLRCKAVRVGFEEGAVGFKS